MMQRGQLTILFFERELELLHGCLMLLHGCLMQGVRFGKLCLKRCSRTC